MWEGVLVPSERMCCCAWGLPLCFGMGEYALFTGACTWPWGACSAMFAPQIPGLRQVLDVAALRPRHQQRPMFACQAAV